MLSYIIRRLLLAIPTLIGMTAVVFFIMALSPGGTAADLLSKEGQMKPQEREAIRAYLNERYGLDKPLVVQYVRWLNHISPIGFHTDTDRQTLREAKARAWANQRAATDRDLPAKIAAKLDLPRDRVDNWLVGRAQLSREQLRDVLPLLGRTEADLPTYRWPAFKWPDLGTSMVRSRKVSDLIADALPVTLTLNLIALPLIYSFSILIGIQAARQRGKLLDVGSGTVLLAFWSFPVILAGLLLQGYLANQDKLGWFPVAELHDQQAASMPFLPHHTPDGGWQRGYFLDTLWHLVLPVICMTYGGFAFLSKLSRGAVLENIATDYVRTARAKGVSEKGVLYRHVFRNSLIPLITFAAHLLPALIGGSVVVETIFSLRGMGYLIVDSIFLKDREVVLAEALIVGLLTLISYIIADILYAVADPRVTYD
jgi:peptide/nickel transport system permease protein